MGDIWSNERQPSLAAGLGEGNSLCEKAIAGMDRVAARSACDLDHRSPVQVSGCAEAWQRPNLVCHAQVQTARIVLRMHSNGGQAQVGRSARDANGDLAAVGDQQLGHGHTEMSDNGER
jgi:hypothetical protein